MANAFIEASFVCDHCNTRLVMVGIGSNTKAIKTARKYGWQIGEEKVLCDECKKDPDRHVYMVGNDIVVYPV